MKNKSVIFGSIAIAATVAVVSLGVTMATFSPSFAHGSKAMPGGYSGQMGSDCEMMEGRGHMGGMMAHGGHMGGMMAGQMHDMSARDLDLSIDDVRKIIEGRMVWHGNDRLKVGTITAVDDNTITAEIVTVDDSLVVTLEFDRKTGSHHPVR